MDYNMQTSMDGSPFMTGSWYNPKTGDSFTVRDTYMEDNNLFVMTTDGRRMDYNMISQYVQTDKPIAKQDNNFVKNENDDLPDEVKALMAETGDADLLNTPIHNTPMIDAQAPVRQNIYRNPEPVDEDALLIKRMLGRSSSPEITCTIQWSNFPVKQLDMLDTMAVDPAKIAEFYISKVNLNTIRQQIADEITSYIDSKLNKTGECLLDTNDKQPSYQSITESKPSADEKLPEQEKALEKKSAPKKSVKNVKKSKK